MNGIQVAAEVHNSGSQLRASLPKFLLISILCLQILFLDRVSSDVADIPVRIWALSRQDCFFPHLKWHTHIWLKSLQIISVRAFLGANMIIHLLNNNSVNIYSQRMSSLYSNHTVLFSEQIWSRYAIDFHNVIFIQYPTVILEPTSEHLCASLSHGTHSLCQILCWLAVS